MTDVFQSRSDTGADLPRAVADAVLAAATRDSIAMTLFRKVNVPTRANKVPVQVSRPQSQFIGTPDTGYGSVAHVPFAYQDLIVEEIMTVVPVPNSVIEDQEVDLWAEVQPQIAASIASAIDDAVVWGVGKPSTFGPSVIENIATKSGGRVAVAVPLTSGSAVVPDTSASAGDVGKSVTGRGVASGVTVASVVAGTSFTMSASAVETITGNVLVLPANPAFVVKGDVFNTATDNPGLWLQAAERVSRGGYSPSGAVLAPGAQYRASAARTQALTANPVGSSSPFAATIAGLGLRFDPLRWNGMADALVGAFNPNAILGVRRDITAKLFDAGTIGNADGTNQFNLIMQDMMALRLTIRVGSLLVNPPTDTAYAGTPNSFAAVVNSGAPGLVGGVDPAYDDDDRFAPLRDPSHDEAPVKPATGRRARGNRPGE